VLCLNIVFFKRGEYLQAGRYTVDTIEFTSGRLGVEVTAGNNWRQVFVAALTSGENVADGIEFHRAADGLAPANEKGSTGDILVGQCLAVTATSRKFAMFGHFHQSRPQSVAVYL